MKSLIISLLLTFAVALAALFFTYPWTLYKANFNFSWQETLASYLVLAGMMAILSGLLLPLGLRRFVTCQGVSLRAGVAQTLASVGMVFLLVLLFSGPGFFWNIPGTQVQGIFFAEWKFVVFFFQVGIPFSAVNGAIQVWLRSRTTTGGA